MAHHRGHLQASDSLSPLEAFVFVGWNNNYPINHMNMFVKAIVQVDRCRQSLKHAVRERHAGAEAVCSPATRIYSRQPMTDTVILQTRQLVVIWGD